jgi:predicted nuclease of predicted toxin-antitoxin system
MSSNPTPKYLIDANLPRYFSLWNTDEFIHQSEIEDTWTDEQIWKYATENDLTIVTKDADFSNKIIFHQPPPKVIHIRFGNMKMRDFFTVMTTVWQDTVELSETHKLVNVFRDRIEGIE